MQTIPSMHRAVTWLRRITQTGVMGCAIACAVSACSVNSIQPGMARDAVLQRMGPPDRVVPLASGTRLQYSRQPAGQQSFMVDLDASDQVVQVRQMLQAPEFARITPGTWTRNDVEREFGRPASIDRVGNWPYDILTYRWAEVQDMFYWIYLDQNNVVQRTGQGVEYPRDRLNRSIFVR